MESVVLLFGVIVLTLVFYVLKNGKRKKYAPGPIGLPLLGYYPFIKKDPVKTVKGLAEKYGNTVGLYLGPQYVVFLNDWEAVKDALGQNATVYRPPEQFGRVRFKMGVGGINGEEWVESRRVSSKVMKDSLQKNSWEDLVQMDVSETTNLIEKEAGKPICIQRFFSDTFANNIMSLVRGERFSVDHPVTKMVIQSVDWILEYTSNFEMVNFSPAITKIMQKLGLEEDSNLGEKLNEFIQFWSDTVDRKVENPDDSFIIRLKEEIDSRNRSMQESVLTEDSFKGTVITMVTGGSETTRSSILWLLIAMADHPDKQRKVHEELDRVIGRDGSIRWSGRSKVPYTLATIMESMRWRTLVPFPGMRMAFEDCQIQGYHIPKGTFIITNNWLLHNDPKYWENPDQFIPERFLLENGTKVNAAPDSYNPFSYGKRNCPGKLLAMMQMLQYFSSLMQKFQVLPKEGDRVQHRGVLGLTYQARNAELRFIPR